MIDFLLRQLLLYTHAFGDQLRDEMRVRVSETTGTACHLKAKKKDRRHHHSTIRFEVMAELARGHVLKGFDL